MERLADDSCIEELQELESKKLGAMDDFPESVWLSSKGNSGVPNYSSWKRYRDAKSRALAKASSSFASRHEAVVAKAQECQREAFDAVSSEALTQASQSLADIARRTTRDIDKSFTREAKVAAKVKVFDVFQSLQNFGKDLEKLEADVTDSDTLGLAVFDQKDQSQQFDEHMGYIKSLAKLCKEARLNS